MRRPSQHPENARSRDRVRKEKYKKGMSENVQDLMKKRESQVKYPLSRLYKKHMCTCITILIT